MPSDRPVGPAHRGRLAKARESVDSERRDGAGSSDPDGDALEHLFILEDDESSPSVLAAGERTTVTLPRGRHSIAHRVRDPAGLVSSALFGVNVVDTTPPVATAVPRPALLTSCCAPRGRTYTLTYLLTDSTGNARTLEVPVVVPRTLSK